MPAIPILNRKRARELRPTGRDAAHRRRTRQARAGYCAITLVPRPEVAQQHGYVHAGIVAAIVDTAGGYAGFTLFPPDSSVLTVEFKLNLLAPAHGELLVAEGFVVKPGPHARDHARRSARGARRQAYAGGADAADAHGDARQDGSPTHSRRSDVTLDDMLNFPSLSFHHGETIDMLRATVRAVRRRRDRAARRRRSTRRTSSRWTCGARWATSACSASPSRRSTAAPAMGYLAHFVAMEEISPRLGLGRAVLRRAFEPVRQPDPPQRQRRAEAASTCRSSISGEHVGALADERAGRRLGRRVDAPARRRARATATCSTATRCGSPTARTPTRWSSTPRPTRGRAHGHHRVPDREGHEGLLDRAEARQARHARLQHLRARVPGLRGAGGERPRRRRAAA